jgi:hypothetical protein
LCLRQASLIEPLGPEDPVSTLGFSPTPRSIGMTPQYDILKKEGLAVVWIEASSDIDAAESRIKELARQFSGEYVIFDQRLGQMIANVDGRPSRGEIFK